MIEIVIIVSAIFCIAKWVKWRVITFALIYYMTKNQYRQPSQKEIVECTGFAIKNMLKDLVR